MGLCTVCVGAVTQAAAAATWPLRRHCSVVQCCHPWLLRTTAGLCRCSKIVHMTPPLLCLQGGAAGPGRPCQPVRPGRQVRGEGCSFNVLSFHTGWFSQFVLIKGFSNQRFSAPRFGLSPLLTSAACTWMLAVARCAAHCLLRTPCCRVLRARAAWSGMTWTARPLWTWRP